VLGSQEVDEAWKTMQQSAPLSALEGQIIPLMQIEPERPKDETLWLLYRFLSPCQPGDGYGVYPIRFLDFFQKFFITSSGLRPVHDAMLRPQRQGRTRVRPLYPRSTS